MRVAIVENDVIINMIEAETTDSAAEMFDDVEALDASGLTAGIGWRRVGDGWQPPTLLVPSFPELSPRQIRRGLASIGITEDQVEALLSQLPDASDALIDWRYANSYQRDHPLVAALIVAFQHR